MTDSTDGRYRSVMCLRRGNPGLVKKISPHSSTKAKKRKMCMSALRVANLLSFILPFPSSTIKSRCLLQAGTAKQDSAEFTGASAGHSFASWLITVNPLWMAPQELQGYFKGKALRWGRRMGRNLHFKWDTSMNE